MMTADELYAEGRKLSDWGMLVVFLYPSQEWMAVKTQTPFLRYGKFSPHKPEDAMTAVAVMGTEK